MSAEPTLDELCASLVLIERQLQELRMHVANQAIQIATLSRRLDVILSLPRPIMRDD